MEVADEGAGKEEETTPSAIDGESRYMELSSVSLLGSVLVAKSSMMGCCPLHLLRLLNDSYRGLNAAPCRRP
jgi:hypothetical protein